jgi:hypothetical protein
MATRVVPPGGALAALVVAVTLLNVRPLAGQQRAYHGRNRETTVHVPRVEGDSITIDGVLDEGAWRKAALLTGFSTSRSTPAGRRLTEVWFTS